MQSKYSLKKKKDFDFLIKFGTKIKTDNLLIFYKKDDFTKIGISIPKKLGNAVMRNKNKRQIKSILNNIDIKNYLMSILIIVKEKYISLPFEEKEKLILSILKKIAN